MKDKKNSPDNNKHFFEFDLTDESHENVLAKEKELSADELLKELPESDEY